MGFDWIRLDTYGILRGSIIAQLTLEERAAWVSILCFAGEQRERGVIRRAKGIPYTREEIATALSVPLAILNSTIEKCIQDENADDPTTRISIGDDDSIVIGNWKRYQTKAEKAIAKEVAIEKAKRTKKRNEAASIALIQLINELNKRLKLRRYEMRDDGAVLDTQTGQLIAIEKLKQIQKGVTNDEQ